MWKEERGAAAVMVSLSLTALLGIAGLAIDAGHLYIDRQKLTSVADATALSAAQLLPADPDGAVQVAKQYLTKNSVDPADATITVAPDHRHISVTLRRPTEMTFARVLGFTQFDVAGSSEAWAANLSGVHGAVPLGVSAGSFTTGDTVILKLSPYDGYVAPGDYQALALGSSGASDYENNLQYGYQGWIRVGDWLETKPGNMAGPTVHAVNYRIGLDPLATWDTVQKGSPRLVVAPILRDYEVNGRGEVNVIGFGVFFLEQGIDQGNEKGEVVGRFVRMAMSAGEVSPDAPDYGALVIKLSN